MDFMWAHWFSLYLRVCLQSFLIKILLQCERILAHPVLAPEACPQEAPLFPVGLLEERCALPPPSSPLPCPSPWDLVSLGWPGLPPPSEPKPACPVWGGLGACPIWLLSRGLPDRCYTPWGRDGLRSGTSGSPQPALLGAPGLDRRGMRGISRPWSQCSPPGPPGPSDKVLGELAVVGMAEQGSGRDTGVSIHCPPACLATCSFFPLGSCPGLGHSHLQELRTWSLLLTGPLEGSSPAGMLAPKAGSLSSFFTAEFSGLSGLLVCGRSSGNV